MNRVIVEAQIAAPVELVWERTQEPALHQGWDLRFDEIGYLPRADARGFRELEYRTRIGFGLFLRGVGRYLSSTRGQRSSFEFDSDDWKSLIAFGRGVWLYQPNPAGTFFKTVYDYRVRHGALGRAVDSALFRPLIQLATEWSFETLRRWCEGDRDAVARRRSWLKFGAFMLARRSGWRPGGAHARSWLGRG